MQKTKAKGKDKKQKATGPKAKAKADAKAKAKANDKTANDCKDYRTGEAFIDDLNVWRH